MDGMDKHIEQRKDAKKKSRTGGYLSRIAENKLPDPPDSFREMISDELGLNMIQEMEMTEYNRRADDKMDYSRLTRLMEHNHPLLVHICSRTGLKKEDVVGAAILYFSALPLDKQLEIAAEYQEKC